MPKLTGPITTTAPSDTYPTHDSVFGVGGLREVPATTDRNAIPASRRRAGMIVFTQTDGKYWQLHAAPWLSDNTDWSQILFAGTGTVTGITMYDSAGNGWALSVATTGNLITTSTGTTGYPNTYGVTYT